jgi:CBS domain containing-hemolysin-like protein
MSAEKSEGKTVSLTKKTVKEVLDETKSAIKEYLHETEIKLKERFRKLIISSIISIVLVTVAISFMGTAAIFITIGGFKYLSMFMQAWLALILMGITSIVIGLVFLLAVFIIIRRQLKTPKK